MDQQACPRFFFAGLRDQLCMGHRRDAGKGFSAKTQGTDGVEVPGRGDFAGSVAQERRFRLYGGDSAAVVGDADIALSAVFDLYGNGRRLRVNGVLYQFLDDGDGALYDLACGDLVSYLFF